MGGILYDDQGTGPAPDFESPGEDLSEGDDSRSAKRGTCFPKLSAFLAKLRRQSSQKAVLDQAIKVVQVPNHGPLEDETDGQTKWESPPEPEKGLENSRNESGDDESPGLCSSPRSLDSGGLSPTYDELEAANTHVRTVFAKAQMVYLENRSKDAAREMERLEVFLIIASSITDL